MITPESSRTTPEKYETFAVLDASRAAALLGISRATLYRQLSQMPPRVRLSTRRFGWRVSDLALWVEARRELCR